MSEHDWVDVEVDDAADGVRADRGIARLLEAGGHAVSRSQLARAFTAEEVRLEGRALKPSKKLRAGQRVRVRLPEPPPLSQAFAEDIPLELLHEDEHLLVLVKPAGMVVHASPGHDSGTLVNAVLGHLGVGADALPVLPGNDATRPGIVHRLDKDTSGVMVVAKEIEIQRRLAKLFAAHDIGRRYRCFCRDGHPKAKVKLTTPHGRDPNDRRRFAPVKGAKRTATSIFERVADYQGEASQWTVQLETGRTHQIRMHARFLKQPILGDELYGSRPRSERLREACADLSRQALHAEYLAFVHPQSEERLEFEAPLADDLVTLRERLEAMPAKTR